ncbi:transglutaminase-like domain-containing protein [Opitutaceae bacterium]|nr:transglutaminase-like domain-containing protein [Opitutaceae bacterium]
MLWTILVLGLLIANIVHIITRSWESSFYQTSYATIYFPTDVPTILEWHERKGGVEAELNWNQTADGWVILKNGEPHTSNDGPFPFFPELEDDIGWYDYTAIPQPEEIGDPLEIELRFLPNTYWSSVGLPRPDSYMIRTDIPHGRFKQYPVAEWIDDYSYLAEEDLAEIDRILTKEVGIKDSDGTLRVLEKLTAHFRDALGTRCRGNPDHDDRWRDPFTIYRNMRDGTGKGYCTQHTNIFLLFANRAGLSTRTTVGARTKDNNFVYTGHAWIETWVPEQGRWAWSDPSYALVYATNPQGEVINSVDLSHLRKQGTWAGVNVRVYKDWASPDLEGEEKTFVDAPFPAVGDVVQRQFLNSAIYKWRRPPNVEDIRSDYTLLFKNWTFFWANLERYYFKPPLAIANYPTEGNRTYLVRHFLLWTFLTALVGTVISWRKSRR